MNAGRGAAAWGFLVWLACGGGASAGVPERGALPALIEVEPATTGAVVAPRPTAPPAVTGVPSPPPAPAVTPASPAMPGSAAVPQPASLPADPLVPGGVPAGDRAEPAAPPAPIVAASPDTVPGALELRLADGANLWPSRLPRKDRDAIATLYRFGAFAPVWVRDGAWTDAAKALSARLARAGEDGLDPAEYPVPVIAPAGRPASPADLAEAEIKLSAVAALYARDARGGRIDLARLSSLITPKLDLPAGDAVLAALRAAPDPGAALESYNPRAAGYGALKAKLAEIRASRPGFEPMARAPRGREVTTQSIAILSDVPAAPPSPAANPRLEGELLANMERWRWLPADLGSRYVAVNIPEFRLKLVDDGRVVHEARVITGRPDTPTPVFSGTMEYAIVNPSWYIPPSIMKKEILPGLAADPLYAERRGYEVIRRGNAISVRQPPGERNALGFIKFMFPNGHSVYLHDTPNRNLFGAGRRAFSHGCVRVDDPFRLADFVLGHEWSETRLKRLIGRGERTIFLPRKLPVHLTYFTLTVDEAGELRSFEDIYGYSRRVRAALGLGV